MKKFAEALDMNPSTLYSGYLNGRSLPGPVLLVKLIDLGCNINWLLTSRESPFISTPANEERLTNAVFTQSPNHSSVQPMRRTTGIINEKINRTVSDSLH